MRFELTFARFSRSPTPSNSRSETGSLMTGLGLIKVSNTTGV